MVSDLHTAPLAGLAGARVGELPLNKQTHTVIRILNRALFDAVKD